MVNNCVAFGCKNYVGKKDGLSFFRFPLNDRERCDKWTAAVRRADWKPTKSSRLCNEHFVTGSPRHHPSHPDYIPSIFSFGGNKDQKRGKERYKRRIDRIAKQQEQREQKEKEKEKQEREQKEKEERIQKETKQREKEQKEEEEQAEKEEMAKQLEASHTLLAFSQQEFVRDATVQTDNFDSNLVSQVELLKAENCKLKLSMFSVKMIAGNDSSTQFYTGLPSCSVFLHLYTFLTPHVTPSNCLPLDEEFFLVLVKFRLNLMLQDVATRFSISLGSVSLVFQKWLDVMFVRLRFLISWPNREVVRRNMPRLFKELYPNCVVIIDCSEVFIETPSKFEARSKTYSNYKKHNTIKFLIGITPCGSISFLSQCWGGRVSDKNLTQECVFLNMLQQGDVVLADRGFTIEEDVALCGAKLEIPAFTRGKKQLSQYDVEKSKQLSAVRIHVERIIGTLKNRYTIMKGPLATKLLKHRGDEKFANIDKILVVCSALTNLGKRVVA